MTFTASDLCIRRGPAALFGPAGSMFLSPTSADPLEFRVYLGFRGSGFWVHNSLIGLSGSQYDGIRAWEIRV